MARIAAAVVAVVAAVAVVTLAVRPEDPVVPSAAFGRQFVSACTRSGVDEQRCACAWDRWQEAVPAQDQRALDDKLAHGDELPDALRAAIERCEPG